MHCGVHVDVTQIILTWHAWEGVQCITLVYPKNAYSHDFQSMTDMQR